MTEMEEVLIRQGRSLAETPTYSVASVVTVLVFVCFIVERAIYRFGKWLKKTRRKALFASLEKIKEELMLLGLISLLLAQWARWISEICVNSSLFSSKFYLCSEQDYGVERYLLLETSPNETAAHLPFPHKEIAHHTTHQCGQGREPFVSLEGLEQLHRFLFVLGITHVLYSCLAVGLAMTKIYSWRKWENQATMALDGNVQEGDEEANNLHLPSCISSMEQEQGSHLDGVTSSSLFSLSSLLVYLVEEYFIHIITIQILQLCFFRQFKSSIKKSDYLALRLGFITHRLPLSYNFHNYMVRSMEDEFQGILGISPPLWAYSIICIFINIHGLNVYFWLSFIPAILVMVVGTKLQHVVSMLALGIVEQSGPPVGTQVKPRDDLFWFGKPEILVRLIQFIIFQWGFKQRSCFMKNHYMIIIRLVSGVVVQFWCSYSTVPLNVLVTQMGSRCRKALVAESVRDSLHSWCKRVKERSRRDAAMSIATRSVCSLDTATIDEGDEEVNTVASGTISRSSSMNSLNQITVEPAEEGGEHTDDSNNGGRHRQDDELSLRIEEYLKSNVAELDDSDDEEEEEDDDAHGNEQEETKIETLLDLFRKN
ncbi:MLO-like protein 4 [Linum perenne]